MEGEEGGRLERLHGLPGRQGGKRGAYRELVKRFLTLKSVTNREYAIRVGVGEKGGWGWEWGWGGGRSWYMISAYTVLKRMAACNAA
jgi:hypothetical protein